MSQIAIKSCCVPNCTSKNQRLPILKFVPLPNSVSQKARLENWLVPIGRPDLWTCEPSELQCLHVCQKHQKIIANRRVQPLRPSVFYRTLLTNDSLEIFKKFAKTEKRGKMTENFKDFCMNLYQCCPLQYKTFWESLGLLSLGSLHRHCREAMAQRELRRRTRLLALKTLHMTPAQRDCTICLGAVDLQPGFYYNISRDCLVGVGEGDHEQQEGLAARVAIVAVLQGLRASWRQPLAITLRSELDAAALVGWLDTVVAGLPQLPWHALGLHAVVVPLAPPYYHAAQLRGVDKDYPWFKVNNKNYCIFFDPNSIMRNVRYYFMQSKICFRNKVVDWEHIVRYYTISRNHKMSLTPNLTESQLLGVESGGLGALGRPVARALSVLAALDALPAAAAHTADFLAGINDVYDVCSSSFTPAKKRKRPRDSKNNIQTDKLEKCLEFLNEVTLRYPVLSKDANVNFVNAFTMNIRSISEIYNSLEARGIDSLSTRRLASCADEVVKDIQKALERRDCKRLSSHNFLSAFNGVSVTHYMRPNIISISRKKIKEFLKILDVGLNALTPVGGNLLVGNARKPQLVNSSSYRSLRLPCEDPARYLAGFLLATCFSHHQMCQKLQTHIMECCIEKEKFAGSGYIVKDVWTFLKTGQEYVVRPPAQFLLFLQRLEKAFRLKMSCGLPTLVMAELEDAVAVVKLPGVFCSCFPVPFAKQLFLRVRLNLTLRRNKGRVAFHNDLAFRFQDLIVENRFKTIVLCD